MAAVPFVEGEVYGEPWFFRRSDDRETELVTTIASRRRLQFVAPEEPGVYDFFVALWRDAFIPKEDRGGRAWEHRGRPVLQGGGRATNSIRFIVEE